MHLTLNQILPTYFDKSLQQASEVWGKPLVFQKGELIKIVAPSGSGKTSLIHFIYGLRDDYEGEIKYDSRNIRTLTPELYSQFRKEQISIVFQDLRLFPEITVAENLEIKRQLNPVHPPEKIREMAERLGIASKLNSKCQTCSYGEQQRIAIIRSLLQPFDFLLLDEPFSHLDEENAEKAMKLMLEEAATRKAAIVFADLERIDFYPYTRLFHL